MFSFLKPSSTVSIMKRIARVCQSMLLSVSTPGFERKSDRHAIKTDIVSISSFFSRQSIFLIVDPPAPMICMQRKCRRSNPAQRVRFGKEKQHHRSIGRRLRRRMTSWCCFDAGTPARARTGDLGLRRLALYPTELQTHTVYGRRNCAIVFYLLMCDAVKGAFRLWRHAFFRKRRCNRIHRVIFLAYMDGSPVKLNRNIRMKEPCVIHGL